MKRLASILLSLALLVGGGSAVAGPWYEDGQDDAHQGGDPSLDAHPTLIDIKAARFMETKKKFTFKVTLHSPVDMTVFCTDVDCGDHANRGYLDIDFYTEKKDGAFKRYYFFEIRSEDGGYEATLREMTDKGSEIIKVVPVDAGKKSFSVSVKRKFLDTMSKGKKFFWNASSIFWWDPLEDGDLCNYVDGSDAEVACIDFVPDEKDAGQKLKK